MEDGTRRTFSGTLVREGERGPVLLSHRQRLVVISGPDAGLVREIHAPRVALGTAAENDLVLKDPAVSRHHAEISVRGDRYVLRDLGSTNGTEVGGTRVVEAFLSPGARIKAGDSEILFEPKKKWARVPDSEATRFGGLVGASTAMRSIFGLLEKIAPTELTVVLLGESGTGKELAARAIHGASRRKSGPFVVVDCAAISETLIESELFGHEKGAFTGADSARAGAFELAAGGTVFLDEIGELPLELQPKLLRALERREVKRLGAEKTIDLDVRIVAATHRDLAAMVDAKELREDLYYRLAEVVIGLPALRERRDDVGPIAEELLAEESRRTGRRARIEPEVVALLSAAEWRGNARELRNVLRRAAALATGETLRREDIEPLLARSTRAGASSAAASGGVAASGSTNSEPVSTSAAAAAPGSAPSVEIGDHLPLKDARELWLAPLEREYLTRVVARAAGDLDLAAQQAGIHRKSLERLLRQHGLR